MDRKILILFLLVTFPVSMATAEEARKPGNKWKTIMTIVGAGGGFALGMAVGLSAYDDAIDSDRKVYTAAALTSVGGGVAGYFLGRHMDKSRTYQEYRVMPEIRWNSLHNMPPKNHGTTIRMLHDSDPIELLSGSGVDSTP